MPYKPKPPSQLKQCPKTRVQIARMLWIDSMTITEICQELKCSSGTFYKWMAQFNIDNRLRQIDFDTFEDARMTKDGKIEWLGVPKKSVVTEAAKSDGSERSLNEGHLRIDEGGRDHEGGRGYEGGRGVNEGTAYPMVRPEPVAPSLEPEEPQSTLTYQQRKAVMLLGSLAPEDLELSKQQKADRLGVSTEALTNWMRDSEFRQAVIDFNNAEFEALGTISFNQDLIRRYQDNKHPSTEVLKVMASVLPLKQAKTSVGIFVKMDGGLKDRFR